MTRTRTHTMVAPAADLAALLPLLAGSAACCKDEGAASLTSAPTPPAEVLIGLPVPARHKLL